MQLAVHANYSDVTKTSNVSVEFSQHSSNFTEHIGGIPSVFEESGYIAWIKTLTSNPAIIMDRVTMIPIHQLIGDNTKQENMRQMLIQYCSSPESVHR